MWADWFEEKTQLKAFFPFPHKAPDLPCHPYAKEFSRTTSALPPKLHDFTKVTPESLQIIHTQIATQSPPPGVPRLSPSQHCATLPQIRLWKPLAPIPPPSPEAPPLLLSQACFGPSAQALAPGLLGWLPRVGGSPNAGSQWVQGSQMPATLHQPTSGSPRESAVITTLKACSRSHEAMTRKWRRMTGAGTGGGPHTGLCSSLRAWSTPCRDVVMANATLKGVGGETEDPPEN